MYVLTTVKCPSYSNILFHTYINYMKEVQFPSVLDKEDMDCNVLSFSRYEN